MGLREKVALVLTVVLTVQISTSYCVTSVYKPDALQRYLDKEKLKTTKSPYVTGSSVKFNKNASLKKSLIKAFNFPEIEYPSDASTRDYYTLGNNFNRNSFGPVPKKVPSSQSKAVEDFKKDLRMKRKLDKIPEHYHTPEAASTFITSLSGPESVILTDKEVFPEVQYPLNALETWAPHYWNPPTIAQKELDYERPESLIFNPKGSDKSNKPYAPYKKQVKSKVKLFMEDIDKLNEKRYTQKTQYKETQDSNNMKEPAIIKNDFNTPDSNNSKISLLDPEGLSNKTTEVSSCNIHNDSANFKISENQDLKDLLIEIHERNNTSPQPGLSQVKSDVPDSTSIPYKIQEESNFPSQSEYKNVENEDSHRYKEEKDYLIPKVEEEVVEEVELQIPLSTVTPKDSSDLQATTITTGNTNTVENTAVESLDQTYKDTVIISNDEPLNVNIPLPELDTYDETVPDFSNKTTPLSDINKNPRPTIIVVPVDDYVNMMQIPNFNRLSDASIIVLTPTKKDVTAITASNTFNSLPIINERNPFANTRSTSSDFEMLPNNSMCHVISNAVTCPNMTTQHYNVNEFTDALSTSEDNDIIQNTTTILCDTNNSSEINSEVILPCILLHNTPTPLPNDFPNRMPSNIVPDPTLLHRIEDTVTNSKSTEIPIDKITNQEMNHYTSFELADNGLPSSVNRVDFSLFNFDDVKQFSSEINKLSDIQKANLIRSVNKIFQQKSVTDGNVLPDSQLIEQENNTVHQDVFINNERSERNQDKVISKDVQIPTQIFLNYSHNNVNSGNFYRYISNTNISNVEEENSGMPENNQILSIPLTKNAKSEETLLESKKNEQKMVTVELVANNDQVDQTKDIQDASESMTHTHEPHLVTTLAAHTPGQEDSYSIEHVKLEDMTYPTDNSTSIMENALQDNEIHDTTMDIPVSYEKQFIDNITVPISIKNRLPLRQDSDNEKRLPSEIHIDYSPSLPSFSDNSTISNTGLDNDEQPLLNDLEQEKNIYLISNDTLRDAVNIDYITNFENNSNAENHQNTIQSEISSAESFLLNTDKKNILHSEENMSLLFTPVQEDSNSIVHVKPEDMTYLNGPTDNSTSIMENALQDSEIHDTTVDIPVSYEKQFIDNITVPISIKTRLPLRQDSDHEKRLPSESNIDYSPSLPSFSDNSTIGNTGLNNDEQPLLNDLEQEQNNHLISNDTLRDAVNIDYIASFKNNSNSEKYQNNMQSEIRSAESLLLNTDMKNIAHSEENMSLLFTPVQEDSYSIVHVNLEDMTNLNGPADNSTSIKENALQDSEILGTTMDVPVSYEKQLIDNITVPISIKTRLPLRQDSDYEKKLPSECNIDYSPSLPSFSDNSTISNTGLDNDEQPLLNDLEQEQNIYLISNDTLRDAVNIDYIASFKNNSNSEKYQNTMQSEISSAESLLLNTDMKNIAHSEENMSLLFTPVQEDSYSIVHVNLEDMTYLNGPADNSTSIMENALQDSEIHGTTMDIPVSYEKQFIDNITVPISIKTRLPLRQDSDHEKRLPSESNIDYSPSLPSFSDNSTISNTGLDNDEQPLLNDLEQEQNNHLISNDTLRDAVNIDYIASFKNNSNSEKYQNNMQSEISSAVSLLLNTDMKNIAHSEENMSLLLTPVQEDSYSIVHVKPEDMTYLNGPTDNSTSIMENALQDSEIHDTTVDIPVSYEKQFIDNITVPISIKTRLPLRQDSDHEKRLPSESNIDYSPSLPSFSDNSTISNTGLDNDEQPLLNDLEREQNIYLISNDTLRDAVNIDYITSFENNSNAEEYQNTIQSEISSAESLLLNTHKKNIVHPEKNMSLLLIDNHQNDVIENESIVITPPQDSDNESYESLNEVLTETILNDISDDDMRDNESTTLLDGSEEAIQETYTNDIYVKIFPATLFIDTVSFNPLEVNEPDSDKSLTDYDIESETINESFDVSSINIDREYNPLLVDELLVNKYFDDEEPLQTDITF